MAHSFDSGQRPLNSHYRYESASVNDYDYEPPSNPKYTTNKPAGRSKWLKIGLPIGIIALIIAGVVGGILATKHKNASTSSNGGDGSGSGGGDGGGGGGGNGGGGSNNLNVKFFTATDAYGLPVYPTTVSGYSLFLLGELQLQLHPLLDKFRAVWETYFQPLRDSQVACRHHLIRKPHPYKSPT